jgi:putative ABC transport system permease protein
MVDCTVGGHHGKLTHELRLFHFGLFTSVVGTEPTYNGFMVNLTKTDDTTEDELSSMVADNDNILTVTFTSQLLDDFSDTMDSLNYVVLVIIVCAGALAFIVLYNLANINVTERVRESQHQSARVL